jgi:hypothetical protein
LFCETFSIADTSGANMQVGTIPPAENYTTLSYWAFMWGTVGTDGFRREGTYEARLATFSMPRRRCLDTAK